MMMPFKHCKALFQGSEVFCNGYEYFGTFEILQSNQKPPSTDCYHFCEVEHLRKENEKASPESDSLLSIDYF